MADKPKPLVTDLIRQAAEVFEANQNPVARDALEKTADEMDNDKNGSVHGPSNPHPR